MLLVKRKRGSQRASKPRPVSLSINWAGQGGDAVLTFETHDGQYLTIVPESADDVKALMSHAHIVHHNYREERSR